MHTMEVTLYAISILVLVSIPPKRLLQILFYPISINRIHNICHASRDKLLLSNELFEKLHQTPNCIYNLINNYAHATLERCNVTIMYMKRKAKLQLLEIDTFMLNTILVSMYPAITENL